MSNISNSVKIGPIAERIYLETKAAMNKDKRFNYKINGRMENVQWKSFPAMRSGYFQMVEVSKLLAILKKEDTVLKILPYAGTYLTIRTPLFEVSRQDLSEAFLKEIYSCFLTYTGEDILENEFYGFRQLTEIAVKTLSPAINDPGVARICIDYLGDLLSNWITESKKQVINDEEGKPRIILRKYDFKDLLDLSLTSIKAYGKRDYTILVALLRTLLDISLYDDNGEVTSSINRQAEAIVEEGEQNIFNFLEREIMNAEISILNDSGYFNLPLMNVNKL